MPEDLLELLEVPGVGGKTLKLAYDRLKVRTKEEAHSDRSFYAMVWTNKLHLRIF